MLTVYTLKNCDTCKKALKWLEAEGVEFKNHDVRADGLSNETITEIVETLGWEKALNRRSTTWRNLDEEQKADVDNAKAIALIGKYETLLKRPVFVTDIEMIAGFDERARALCVKVG
jgi:arsenate reductase